jgi:hypothetical protein
MKKNLWILAIVGSVLGALLCFIGLAAAKDTAQETAALLLGISLAVIPNCLAKAVSELGK